MLDSFEVVISIGLDITSPFECIGAKSFEQRLLFWVPMQGSNPRHLSLPLLLRCVEPTSSPHGYG